jgi:hypothetical protein
VVIVVFVCWPRGASDKEKIAALEELCKKYASEKISENSADGSMLLDNSGFFLGLSDWNISNTVMKKRNEPLGSAQLPVLDLEYYPAYLLRTLFSGSDQMSEVFFTRPSTGTNTSMPEECRVTHTLSVKNQEDAYNAFLGKCDVNRILQSVDDVRYSIGQAYGELDHHEIRKFIFFVKDRTNGRVLAEQRSFQLLMGGMKSKELRIRHGWGSSQGTRTCKLTPPDQVIKKVFR